MAHHGRPARTRARKEGWTFWRWLELELRIEQLRGTEEKNEGGPRRSSGRLFMSWWELGPEQKEKRILSRGRTSQGAASRTTAWEKAVEDHRATGSSLCTGCHWPERQFFSPNPIRPARSDVGGVQSRVSQGLISRSTAIGLQIYGSHFGPSSAWCWAVLGIGGYVTVCWTVEARQPRAEREPQKLRAGHLIPAVTAPTGYFQLSTPPAPAPSNTRML